MCVCVRARARVCVRETEREREKAMWSVPLSVHLNVSTATIVTSNRLVAYVTSEREIGKEFCNERFS